VPYVLLAGAFVATLAVLRVRNRPSGAAGPGEAAL